MSRRPSLAVLTYHSLDESGSIVSVAPREFRRHVERLASRGFRLGPAGELVARFLDSPETSHRQVGLSFDDGYLSVVEEALPILDEHGFRATVFPVVDRCSDDNRWPGQPRGVPEARLLGWDHLETLRDAGWEIGAHGRGHVRLVGLDPDGLEREIDGGARRIADRLGIDPEVFAYPYGESDAAVRERVGRSFRYAFGTELGWIEPGSDPLDLPRIDAFYLRGWPGPGLLDHPAGRTYVAFRRLGRRLRKRLRDVGDPGGRPIAGPAER